MKTVALLDLPARREELLNALAQGEQFTVTDEGREIAKLTPSRPEPELPEGTAAYNLIKDLIGSVDGPAGLSNKKKWLALTGFGLDGPARREAQKHLPPE